MPTPGARGGSRSDLGDLGLLKSCLLHEDAESLEVVVARGTFRDVDGVCRRRGGDKIMTGKREDLDAVPLTHAERVVDLTPLTSQVFVAMLFFALASERS